MSKTNEYTFQLPSTWNLSHPKETGILIDETKMKKLGPHDLLAINFLFKNYKKNFKGAILNEQNGFDMQLQVSIFLNVMLKHIEVKFLALLLVPEYLIQKWYHYLTTLAELKTIIINADTRPMDFDDEHGVALLISFDNLELLEHLIGYQYFSVVIDNLDEIVKKPIIKRLRGDLNIGLTTRNFYFKPDQKLQWTMLNWCSPNCCGLSKDFCKIDNDNFENFRDNYRHWWFRLTRHFCESLEALVEEEKVTKVDPPIAKQRRICRKPRTKKNLPTKKENKPFPNEIILNNTTEENEENVTNDSEQKNKEFEETQHLLKFNDSPPNYSDDDDPINLLLSSSEKQTNERVSDVIEKKDDSLTEITSKEEKFSQSSDDVLLSLIGDTFPEKSGELSMVQQELAVKKEELSQQLFSEFPVNTNIETKNDDNNFLMSLID